jgi:hypothetical protein
MSTTVFLAQLWAVLWIRYDAQELGVYRGRLGGGLLDRSVRGWVLWCLFLPLVALPCYVFGARPKHIVLQLRAVVVPDAGSAVNDHVPVVTTATAVPRGPGGWVAQETPAVHVAAPVVMAVPTAPPQLSPDGHWWWDGTQWVPADHLAVSRG